MAKGTTKKPEARDLTTEEKIRQAALKIFTRKGYTGTRTRDISEEAGINLALLNYYFRSKEKLFELVMADILRQFFEGIVDIFNEEGTTLDEKVGLFVEKYTSLLLQQPDLPLFVFHELRLHPEKFASKVGLSAIFKSYFFRQLRQEIDRKKISDIHPLHYVINMIGLCVFPFIAAPVLKHLSGVDNTAFDRLMDERKTLVPHWMKRIMKS